MASNLERVVRIPNPNYKHSGIKSYVYLLNKYGFNPTTDGPYFRGNKIQQQGKFGFKKLIGGKARIHNVLQKKHSSTSEAGEVTAEDQQNDSMWLSEVTIGTPGQTVKLDFDTGSADLWVFSTELPSSILNSFSGSHNIFNPRKSSTFKTSKGSTWQITYGDGSSASGSVGTDNLRIGGLLIKAQAVELARKLSSQFAQGTGDGLLGLAWSSINTVCPNPARTPVDNMIQQGDIQPDQELFTAYSASWRDADQPDKDESFYTFGHIDDTVLRTLGAEPHYAPIDNSRGFWQFSSALTTVGGKSYARAGNTAMADTGTTLTLVDDETCKFIYAGIPGASYDAQNQGWVFPTSLTPAQLPVVGFAVGDRTFDVPKEALAFADVGNGTYYGGIQSRGDLGFDILGGTWLKGIYAIFDQGRMRFGALQRPDPTGETLEVPA